MRAEDAILFTLMLMVGFAIGYNLKQDKETYQTNLAKFEIMYEKCVEYKKSTVSECKELAEFKFKTLVSGG